MTYREAVREFKKNDLPRIVRFEKSYGRTTPDKAMRGQCWNDWTDSLQRDGIITAKQYDRWENPFWN